MMSESRKNEGSVEELRQRVVEKDRIIAELKKILGHLGSSPQQQTPTGNEEYREKIRTLEIENSRLGDLVNKLNKRDGGIEKYVAENRGLNTRVEQLLI